MASKKKYTFIDLFAGCGGLSEGFYRKRFEALAHVEIDKYACETLRRRMLYYGYADADKKVIEHDITADDIIEVAGLVRESINKFLDRIQKEELSLAQIGLSISKEQGIQQIQSLYNLRPVCKHLYRHFLRLHLLLFFRYKSCR